VDSVEEAKAELTQMHVELDTMAIQSSLGLKNKASQRSRHSAPVGFNAASDPGSARRKPDYKLLHQTHVRLRNRFLTQSYRLSPLQTKGSLNNGGHTSTVYCLQLYTYPDTGRQVLFTGSRDRTIREWNLGTRMVERVISGVHTSSVLSICVGDGYLASAGSDKRVGLWNVNTNELVKVLSDHEDSVLCVRFNEEYLVSCSKGE
jgi:F-box and WD-40 domain protein 1/11